MPVRGHAEREYGEIAAHPQRVDDLPFTLSHIPPLLKWPTSRAMDGADRRGTKACRLSRSGHYTHLHLQIAARHIENDR
jgi:hypothetical protein